MNPPKIAVVGAHHTPVRERQDDQSLEEMVFEAAQGALTDAGLAMTDIDGIVLATSDQVQGRVIESMVTSGPAGGVGKDVTTLASAGEHALVYAYVRLLAGQGRRLLVLTWGKPSESVDLQHAAIVEAEPFLLRPLGMRATVAAGLQGSRYASRYGLDGAAVEAVRAARAQAGAAAGVPARDDHLTGNDVVAWPVKVADMPKQVDMAAGLVLVTDDVITDASAPAWIESVGWSTESYELADRELSEFAALEHAIARAVRATEFSVSGADVIEIQELSAIASFAGCEALGLCAPGEGAAVAVRPNVNPSGGNLAAHPGNAAGFMRMFHAAQQARGCAGAVQSAVGPITSVGAAMHGFAGQGAAVALFRGEGSRTENDDMKAA